VVVFEQTVESMGLTCVERRSEIFRIGIVARSQAEARILAKLYRYERISLRLV
jgi:hypothetical protein